MVRAAELDILDGLLPQSRDGGDVFLEAHMTVADANVGRRLAASLDMRLTHIVLAAGQTPEQVLLTKRFCCGGETWQAAALAYVQGLARLIGEPAALRIKLELDLDRSVAAKVETASARGYEHHVKVAVDPSEHERLRRLAGTLGAHLSRNAFARAEQGELRFLTQRFRCEDQTLAARALSQLLGRLSAEGFCVLDVERELVLFDSNDALDAGWGDTSCV